ncbi:LOW QUALITY PROTEIN: semaphorin-6A-like [Lethenteron reissneri]|uniref:LOW QUALITY PROTEIN: semaphorin-6A-like n=1 Tax=Lethenteron reissneri TaxID=7753 RepID=UPI002AB5EF7F|nr:LOW QUALITY PROTEIN: semaphorin-6A-like [Lethenteron reissneri]
MGLGGARLPVLPPMALILLALLRPTPLCCFPEDPKPISVLDAKYSSRYPVFLGHRVQENDSIVETRSHRLDYQLMLKLDRLLLVAERDHIYGLDLDAPLSDEIYYDKRLTWRSSKQERETCFMKGKQEAECRNYIKVLLRRGDNSMFVCGTNAFNPMCRNYLLDTLEVEGEDISGMAKCPYDSRQSNVALFSDGMMYSGTVTDFLAIDAVVYRSMGGGPTLRTIKHDSKWLKEPHFVHAVEYGEHVYFFFREIAVEYSVFGKVVVSRVARVCKDDAGGSQRVLDKHWTSFVKARLNCSVPGDTHFYFNELQALTDIITINGRDVVLGVFTTPANSIPGSAVCAFDMEELLSVFRGRFKEQKSSDSGWTTVPEDKLPKPRPGCCAGSDFADEYKSSSDFPDDTLAFIKTHPLMEDAVGSITEQPWFIRTLVRYRVTRLAVDPSAGPHGRHTVLFLGSEMGLVLKVLSWPPPGPDSPGSLLLEQIDVYNPKLCNRGDKEDRRILDIQLDVESHALFVAFSACVVRLPLSRCERHARCRKNCIAARDPYCGWQDDSCARIISHTTDLYEQDVDFGDTKGMADCQVTEAAHGAAAADTVGTEAPLRPPHVGRVALGRSWSPDRRRLDADDLAEALPTGALPPDGVVRETRVAESSSLVPAALLAICVVSAFVLGAVLAVLVTYCYVGRRRRERHSKAPSDSPPGRPYGAPRPRDLHPAARGVPAPPHKKNGVLTGAACEDEDGAAQRKKPKSEPLQQQRQQHHQHLIAPVGTALLAVPGHDKQARVPNGVREPPEALTSPPAPHPELPGLPTPESTPVLQLKSATVGSNNNEYDAAARGYGVLVVQERDGHSCSSDSSGRGSNRHSLQRCPQRVPRALILPTERGRSFLYGDVCDGDSERGVRLGAIFPTVESPQGAVVGGHGSPGWALPRPPPAGGGSFSPHAKRPQDVPDVAAGGERVGSRGGEVAAVDGGGSGGVESPDSSHETPPRVPHRDVSLKRTPSQHTPSRRVDVPSSGGPMLERRPSTTRSGSSSGSLSRSHSHSHNHSHHRQQQQQQQQGSSNYSSGNGGGGGLGVPPCTMIVPATSCCSPRLAVGRPPPAPARTDSIRSRTDAALETALAYANARQHPVCRAESCRVRPVTRAESMRAATYRQQQQQQQPHLASPSSASSPSASLIGTGLHVATTPNGGYHSLPRGTHGRRGHVARVAKPEVPPKPFSNVASLTVASQAAGPSHQFEY